MAEPVSATGGLSREQYERIVNVAAIVGLASAAGILALMAWDLRNEPPPRARLYVLRFEGDAGQPHGGGEVRPVYADQATASAEAYPSSAGVA